MHFNLSKRGIYSKELLSIKGTYNSEGYLYLSEDFLRLKGTCNRELFEF